MTTGYEARYYTDVSNIARTLTSIDHSLQRIAEATEQLNNVLRVDTRWRTTSADDTGEVQDG